MASDHVAALLLGLVDTLREDSAQDPIDFLAQGCVGLPAVVRAGLVLTDPGGGPIAAYGSDDDARRLVERRDGPVFDCVRSGQPALFGTGCAIPLRCEDQTLGALAIVAHSPPADETLVRVGQTLADGAAKVVVIRREADRTRAVVGQLQTALTSRIGIEQAKGMMAGKLGVGVDEAFRILREYARSHNRRLAEVAAEVMSGEADPLALRGRVVSRQRAVRAHGEAAAS
jgi:ANTAR domain